MFIVSRKNTAMLLATGGRRLAAARFPDRPLLHRVARQQWARADETSDETAEMWPQRTPGSPRQTGLAAILKPGVSCVVGSGADEVWGSVLLRPPQTAGIGKLLVDFQTGIVSRPS